MSEPARLRRLYVENRLQELGSRLGPVDPPGSDSLTSDPSWGPVGSLAQRELHPADYTRLLGLHADMLALERSRNQEPRETETTASASSLASSVWRPAQAHFEPTPIEEV